MYVVRRAFNNNVVMCIDKISNKECILIGKGLGFNISAGEKLKNEKNIEKKFYLLNEKNIKRVTKLYDSIDNDIIYATEKAIAKAEDILNKKLDERIHLSLLDHINFSIIRNQNNMDIKNPFLHEIKLLYKEEFRVALQVINIINNTLKIKLSEDEAGFIAMHINAAINNEDIFKTSKNTEIIKYMIQLLEKEIGQVLDKDSLDYIRLVKHLRFALDIVQNDRYIENVLLDNIKEKLKSAYDISSKITNEVKKNFGINFPDEEIGYITLHIAKIMKSK